MSLTPEPPDQIGQPWTPVSPGGENQLPQPPSPAPPGGEAQRIEPASSAPDGGAGLLGERTFAALIDLAVLLGLFIVVVVGVREAAAVVYLALVLLYYFALESAFGQTVGRRLAGLRVVGPASPTPDSPADLREARTFAALIDLAVLLGLFLAIVLAVGEIGVLFFSLGGGGMAVYLALVLLYYVALEAAFGQTVGKRLLGLRVVRQAGSRRPARNRGIAATLVAAFVLLVVVVVGQQTIDDYQHRNDARNGTYRAHGVSFDYPPAWQEGSTESVGSVEGADKLWSITFGTVTGTDVDLVTVTAYRGSFPATAAELNANMPGLVGLLRQHFEQLGGALHGAPEKLTMAGLPGVRFRANAGARGIAFQTTVVFAFDGRTEYLVNCQHTPAMTAEILQGCDQIVRTFTVNP